ncbi:ExbD/TolR family protein [Reinekea marinisedimentorum]|uniref:Biopolymer transport protein ExbD/TolR n=1 Tax=Reinekea marinisedimentorum TaxID=230495 RepID=A0A4R3I618_9GAMM|nr:biopolymer transporter ExbD [Reinekea marinisedimentorum]TCS40217.1 biopolymer transport protein ExbD/TolR [Reinekea marinisedimentorum]
MSLGNTMKGQKKFVPPAIQITSMMDMFTIIVFFLLFSYSDKPDEFDVSKDIELPTSTSSINYDHALELYLSQGSIKLEENVIGTIDGENVKDLDPDHIAKSPLAVAFTAKKQSLEALPEGLEVAEANALSDVEVLDPSDPHILLFCDRDVPFRVINQVIKAAGSAGFTNFQLAVMEQ